MGKSVCIIVLAVFLSVFSQAQAVQKTKVVVGIVIDQMRADYLTNFNHLYGKGGFNLLKKKGAWFTNCYINYLPAYTGPGHASIYTGSVPGINGIVGNNWYDASSGKNIYCVQDNDVSATGGLLALGKISPRNLKVTTVTDELRLSNNFNSRTFSVSLKDRGAVLPGGHSANAAYWMEDENGHFMTSSYYSQKLPNWVSQFNRREKVREYLNQTWNPLYNKSKYLYAASDENEFEGRFGDAKNTSFPHDFKSQKGGYIKRTPYGNSILFDFAIEAILNENIGKRGHTDFLALSFSATDYIGHIFGPNSFEVEDTYARLDRDLARFIQFLNLQYGKDGYLLFLTADHGAAHNPNYLKSKKIPAAYFFDQKEQLGLNESLEKQLGKKDLCLRLMNCQVYLNHSIIKNETEKDKIQKSVIDYFKKHQLVQLAFVSDKIANLPLPHFLKQYYQNSFFPNRSGDLSLLFYPGVLDAYSTTGTSHGAWSAYDSHIPLVFFGGGLSPQKSSRKVYMTDIAPTLSNLLGIAAPNGSVGEVIIQK
jgi:predicted AlkP superfamily pyrophosphatase or phosphodiesterase